MKTPFCGTLIMSKILLLLSLKINLWFEENLAVKIKLRYYKEVINPNLENHKYLLVITSSQEKINIAKIRMNSHELHSEKERWSIPKTPWMERVCHLCESMSVEDENHFHLECLPYTHTRFEFHSICYNTNLYNLLTCQNYSQLGKLLRKLFEHRNKISKQTKYYPS